MGTNAGIIRGRVARYIYVVVAVVLAILLRVALAEHSITLPTYITFYPVVFLAAMLGGISEGLLATALSALLVDYFLLPPVGQFAIHSTSDIVGMVIFCAAGITVSLVAGLYQRSRERRAAYAIESAILGERENVEEARELTETVRAERQRFLGILESLRTTGSSAVSPGVDPIDRIFSAPAPGSGFPGPFPGLDEKRFRASLRLTVWVPFIAAVILAGAGLWAAYELNTSMQRVDHSDQVIGQSRRLLKLTVDMETGERGYLLTGSDVFLQPYQEASKVIESEYQTLYLLVADNPPQQARLDKLHANINHWQGYAVQMIAVRRTGGAYTDIQANLAGKAQVDEIRDQITAFQSVEEHLRDERTRTARRDWRLDATVCILLGLGIGVGLAVFALRRMEMVAASFEESGRKLAASEQRWATTLESIGDAVIATDNDGRVTFLNQTAAALTGWQSEEALGQPVKNVIPIINEQTRRPAEVPVDRVLKEGRAVELANHTALVAKDGQEIPIEDSAAPILDRDGRIAGVVLVFHDVTEKRRAEEELQSQAELLNLAHDTIMTSGLDGTIHFWNRGAEDMYGYLKQQATGRISHELLKTVFPQPLAEIEALLLQTGSWEGELLHTKQNGDRILVDSRWALQRDNHGEAFGVMEINRDITEAKRAEEFRQSSQYARSLLEASLDPLVTISPEGKISDANEAAIKVTGVARDKLVGTDFADYFTEPDKARKGYQRVFSEGFVTDYPLTIRHADGRLTEVLYNASVYKDDRNNVLGVFAAARDVNELKRAEADLAARAQELARSNADLQQFAYVASHDLQEPLRTISSFSQLLARRYQGKLDSDADDFIAFMVDGAARMQTLINDLLAFSRIDTQGSSFAPTDCEEILHSAEENLKAAIEESGAVITHDSLPRLVADERQLTQLFQNLLSNAIKFRRPETAPRIHVSSKWQNGAWKLSIRDNGIGIDPHYFDRIFVIFQRLHGREQYTGTGIGLAVCKKIVERHGGRLWVESESGTGSIFHFLIPGESNIGEGSLYDESRQRN